MNVKNCTICQKEGKFNKAFCSRKCQRFAYTDPFIPIEGESWKEFQKGLEISSLGRIRSYASGEARAIRPRTGKRGYVQFRTSTHNLNVHQLVGKAFIPNPEQQT